MVHVQVEQRYDAPVASVLGAALDLGFLRARSERYGGAGEPTVVREPDGSVVVRVPRQLPLQHVPGPFRRFVGDGSLVQVDRWAEVGEDRAAASWVVETKRAPIDLRGTHEITTVDGGSRSVITATARVSLPLGGRLAKQVESYLAELVSSELDFLATWLVEHDERHG